MATFPTWSEECVRLRSLIQANLQVLLPGIETEIVTFERTNPLTGLPYIRAGVVQLSQPPREPVPVKITRISVCTLLIGGVPSYATGSESPEVRRPRSLMSLLRKTEDMLGRTMKIPAGRGAVGEEVAFDVFETGVVGLGRRG